ncbi:MAG: hypothetical protein ACRD18_10565 [Terriglobia bacterium]
MKQSRTTNNVRNYVITGIQPGRCIIHVGNNAVFKTTQQKQFSFYVNQTAAFNLTLPVGETTQTVLDGLNDQNSFISSYNVAPIVNQVEEFKVESHNDSAEVGGATGGISNVVAKAGANQFHGSTFGAKPQHPHNGGPGAHCHNAGSLESGKRPTVACRRCFQLSPVVHEPEIQECLRQPGG